MIRRKKRGQKKGIFAEINITPFTDVVLVLLVIFMITTPMLLQPDIKINLPKTQVMDFDDNTNIEVVISQEGYIFMDGAQVHEANLEDTIKSMLSKTPDKPIIIKGDKDVKYDSIIHFMDMAKKAGATKFALAVESGK